MSNIQDLKQSFKYLEEIVCSIDKIGSGFVGTENTALALLLFFKQENILDRLSFIRKIITQILSEELKKEDFEELIESNIDLWKPPYDKKIDELIKLIESIKK